MKLVILVLALWLNTLDGTSALSMRYPGECDMVCFRQHVDSHVSYGTPVRGHDRELLTDCECRQQCRSMPECIGVDYNSDVPPFEDASCWIHTVQGELVPPPYHNVTHYSYKCDRVGACADAPCQNDGTCIPQSDGSYSCECVGDDLAGFAGDNCEMAYMS